MKLKARDESLRDLAEQGCDRREGYESEPEPDCLSDIGRDADEGSSAVFAEIWAEGRRFPIYVDAILALAKLLNGELQERDE